jgi:hypothetical protein
MIEVSITADTKRRAGCSARATLCLNQFFAQRSARGAKLGLTFGERGQLLVGGLFLVNLQNGHKLLCERGLCRALALCDAVVQPMTLR